MNDSINRTEKYAYHAGHLIPMGSPSSGVPEYTVQDSANTWTSSDYWIPTNLHVHNYMVNYCARYYNAKSVSVPQNSWTAGAQVTVVTAGVYVILVRATFNSTNGNQGINVRIGNITDCQSFLNYSYGQPNTLTSMWTGNVSANTICGVNIWSGVARSIASEVVCIRLA